MNIFDDDPWVLSNCDHGVRHLIISAPWSTNYVLKTPFPNDLKHIFGISVLQFLVFTKTALVKLMPKSDATVCSATANRMLPELQLLSTQRPAIWLVASENAHLIQLSYLGLACKYYFGVYWPPLRISSGICKLDKVKVSLRQLPMSWVPLCWFPWQCPPAYSSPSNSWCSELYFVDPQWS